MGDYSFCYQLIHCKTNFVSCNREIERQNGNFFLLQSISHITGRSRTAVVLVFINTVRKENIRSYCKWQCSHIFNIMESGFGMFVSWFFFLDSSWFSIYAWTKVFEHFSFPLVYDLPWHSQSCCRTYVHDFSKLLSHWLLAICVIGILRLSLGCFWET